MLITILIRSGLMLHYEEIDIKCNGLGELPQKKWKVS